jgi:anti-sigma B factor antagonist
VEPVPERDGHDADVNSRERPVKAVDREGGAIVIRLAGELDLYNAEALRTALRDAAAEEPERLVVDLGDVRFVDSTALGVLIEARGRLPAGRGFLLAAPGLETSRALEVSGLNRHFAIHATVADALAADL